MTSFDRNASALSKGKNNKRRILCGDWNKDNKLAYASEDKQITICTVDGFVIDQVNSKLNFQACRLGHCKFLLAFRFLFR